MTSPPASRASNRRVVILLGAGASLQYGAPATGALTTSIENAVVNDTVMQAVGGDAAYLQVRDTLRNYLESPNDVNFEHIYHCIHELIFAQAHTPGAKNEYRPLMHPFLNNITGIQEQTARQLLDRMGKEIYRVMVNKCNSNTSSLVPLTQFISDLKQDFVTRIYTTNYDNFILQADDSLYTGFPRGGGIPQRFELDQFCSRENEHCVFHMHGSVHMGFPHGMGDLGELFWYDDVNTALTNSSYGGTGNNRMDGTGVQLSATITGLDKLSRLQTRPLSHFYSAFARDIMIADYIIVIGSGLGDLHLTNWLHEGRRRNPQPPLLFVGKWGRGFRHQLFPDLASLQEIEMLHKLRMLLVGTYYGWPSHPAPNYSVSADQKSAVYDDGFDNFLAGLANLPMVQRALGL